LIDY
jgi:hypothetical protein